MIQIFKNKDFLVDQMRITQRDNSYILMGKDEDKILDGYDFDVDVDKQTFKIKSTKRTWKTEEELLKDSLLDLEEGKLSLKDINTIVKTLVENYLN